MAFAFWELERDNAHTDEVGAVNTLERFRDNRFNAEEGGAFCRPVAGGACSLFFTTEDNKRNTSRSIVLCRIIDKALRGAILGEVSGVATTYPIE